MSKRSNKPSNRKPGNRKPGNGQPGNGRFNQLFDVAKLADMVADTLKGVCDSSSREAIASTQCNADYYKERQKFATTPEERAAIDSQYEQSRREQQAERVARSHWQNALAGLAFLTVCGTLAGCTYMAVKTQA